MVRGQIKWFGGLNKKTQMINDIGYITPLEGENDVRVYRRDVSETCQKLIEGRQGEGVYIQFDVKKKRQRQQAVNVEPITAIGVVAWFRDGRGYITCEGRPDVRFASFDSFQAEEILFFVLRYNQKLQKDEAIQVQRVSRALDNPAIIQKCIESCIPRIFRTVLVKHAKTLDLKSAERLILKKLSQCDFGSQNILLGKFVAEMPELLLASPDVRRFLPVTRFSSLSYGTFINEHLDSIRDSAKQELLDELLERLTQADTSKRTIYWEQIKYLKQNLTYQGFLWELAPNHCRQAIIQHKFAKFWDTVAKFNNSDYAHAQSLSSKWRNLYDFNENDCQLIRKWDSAVDWDNYKAAQLLSARGAEKLVLQYYKALDHQVDDISIHQITHESQSWIAGDICLDLNQFIDVKNARSSFHSNVYSEFCIPAFKQERGSDVEIAAVLSPYLKKEEMEGAVSPPSHRSYQEVQFLGVFNRAKLEKLEQLFSNRLVRIDMTRGFDSKTYLPHWLFDYDAQFYAQQLELLMQCQQLQEAEIPDWEDTIIAKQNPLPLFIAARRQLPKEWSDCFPEWKIAFINSLVNLPAERLSLPYMFLSLLTHFLSMLSYQGTDYCPSEYRDILFCDYYGNQPLKLYDPLNVIRDWCDTLQTLWKHREEANLTEFRIFKFNGRGLLQGKRHERDFETTILAYCGGLIKGKGKCGHTPLVIGKHKTCLTCGRLICPHKDCGYCTSSCSSYYQ